ncbi:MAG TPA: ribonuclease [Paraburkholderia sp.]|jgi:ribonuclease T1
MARKMLRRAAAAMVVATVAFAGFAGQPAQARSHHRHTDSTPAATVELSALPAQAVDTLHLIAAGGPYPYEKDGVVFGNYERILPQQRRGYYHEYTVPTPRAGNRGARRIVCGGPLKQTGNCYYSDDHYASFKRIVE